ncbi:MAG: hypothetical protein ACYC0B_08530 [Gemmatimonadaceae bacterium]
MITARIDATAAVRASVSGRVASLALAIALVAGTIGAQGADPDKPAAQGNKSLPAGWEMRLDRANADKSTLQFSMAGPAMRVTSGPAAIYWNAKNATTGPFGVEAGFVQRKKPAHAEAFGLIWGGKALSADGQQYYYLIVRGDGKYMVKRRAGTETHELVPWTEHAAITKEDASGVSRNLLKVESSGTGAKLYANGRLLKELPGAAATGIVGVRVNHNLDVEITGFRVTPQ